MSYQSLVGAVLCCVFTAVFRPAAQAAPANDDFAAATALETASFAELRGSTAGATREPNEPFHSAGVQSVWFKWTPSQSGLLKPGGNLGLHGYAIYTNGFMFPQLFKVTTHTSAANVRAGITYFVGVYGPADAGEFDFRLELQDTPPPANDSFANAWSTSGGTVIAFPHNSTFEANEPSSADSTMGSVWYRYIPPFSGRLEITVESGNPIISLFSGTELGSLVPLDALDVTGGVTYYISVRAPRSAEGSLTFRLDLSGYRPSNDNLSDASDLQLQGEVINVSGLTLGATLEPGETNASPGQGSVWFKWSPGQAMDVRPLGTLLAGEFIFFEQTPAGLVAVQPASNEVIRLENVGTYYLGVYSWPEHANPFLLSFLARPYAPPPVNDAFANALELTGSGGAVALELRGATHEADEAQNCASAADNHSVWYKWTAPSAGFFRARAVPSFGISVELLNALAGGTDGLIGLTTSADNSDTTVTAEAGRTYFLRVASCEQTPAASLEYVFVPEGATPENDHLANALVIDGAESSVSGHNFGATTETNEFPILFGAAGATVWYKWIPPHDSVAAFKIMSPTHQVAVYRQQGLDPIHMINSTEFSSTGAIASNHVTSLDTIFLRVDSSNLGGFFTLSINAALTGAPANDNFADATRQTGTNVVFNGTLEGSTIEAGEPVHFPGATKSVWWRWEPGQIGTAQFEVTSFPSNAVLAVYAGDQLSNLSLITARMLFGFGSVTAPVTTLAPLYIAAASGPGGIGASFRGYIISVEKQPQTISFPAIEGITFNPNSPTAIALNAQSDSGLPVQCVVESGSAVINGGEVIPSSPGFITVSANQPGNQFFEPAEKVLRTFYVSKAAQGIIFPGVDVSTSPIRVDASSTSGLAVTLEVVEGSARIENQILVEAGEGPITVRASQEGDEVYAAAESVYQTFMVQQLSQQIEFEVIPVGNSSASSLRAFSSSPSRDFELQATSSAGLPVEFVVVSGAAVIQGVRLSAASSGTIVVRAQQNGDIFFRPAAVDRQITIEQTQSPQTIEFGVMPDVILGVPPIDLVATASSGLPVAFELVAGKASVNGSRLTIEGAGTVTILASQKGNDQYLPAAEVAQSFAVRKKSQTLELPSLPALTFGDSPVPLAGRASSGLPVFYEVTAGPIQISGDSSLVILGAGAASIKATQPGNEDYAAAPPLTEVFLIGKAAQSILLELPENALVPDSLELKAPASSHLPVTFVLISGPAQLIGAQLKVLAPGAITIEASQEGNENYLPASTRRTITALPMPALTVERAGAGIRLSWPDQYPALQVQSATDVRGPWRQLMPETVRANGAVSVEIQGTETQQFLRLSR